MSRGAAAGVFVFGGVLCFYILTGLRDYGASLGASPAGSAGPPWYDALFPLLATAYFVVSAAGAMRAKTSKSLRATAIYAHLVLLISFLLLCLEGLEERGDRFFRLLYEASFLLAAASLPWLFTWALLLYTVKSAERAELAAAPNGGPAKPPDDSGASGGPP